MSEPFLAEIRVFSFQFAPRGWALCNGQLLPINQNQALFSLLGTTFGGNGQTNFALPDLRGRTPIHAGEGKIEGETGGAENVTLTASQLPTHPGLLATADQAQVNHPGDRVLASKPRRGANIYASGPPNVQLAGAQAAGGGQPHLNMQPFLTLNFCIALQGIFPPRN
jgi:microcystin-dependent protein